MKIKDIHESTTSGSIASVASPLGKTQTRAGKLFKGKKTNKPFYEDEVNEADLILVPGHGSKLKPGFIPKDKDRTDHEVEMARSDLYQAAKNAKKVYELIQSVSEEQGLEGWVQEKIIKANDYLNTIREYLEHKTYMQEMTGGVLAGGMSNFEEGVAEGLDPVKRGRLNDLIELYRDATDPGDYYNYDEIEDPDEIIGVIQKEFGNKIADQVATGSYKMHFPRHGIQRSDPLGVNRPVDRITKAGKMYRQDMDYRKRNIKSRMGIDEQSVAEGSLEEIDRRGFLKGVGAAAAAAAAGSAGASQLGSPADSYQKMVQKKILSIFKQTYTDEVAKQITSKLKQDILLRLGLSIKKGNIVNKNIEVKGYKVHPNQKEADLIAKHLSAAIDKVGQLPNFTTSNTPYNFNLGLTIKAPKVSEDIQGVAEEQIDEKKDACYSKVKSRYKVWPSAYASGALVKCRKVGASNWGNSSKK